MPQRDDANDTNRRASVRASVGNIEMSLDDFKAIQAVGRSKSTKRWGLLRNVVRMTVRKSSLTKPEEDLLRAIGDNGRASRLEGTPDRDPSTSPPKAKGDESDGGFGGKDCARRQLRSSICSKQFLLTQKEQAFLESLASAADVSEDALRATNEVLEADRLYQIEEEDDAGTGDKDAVAEDAIEETEEKEPTSNRRRQSILSYRRQSLLPQPSAQQHDPSFRVELWSTTQKKNGLDNDESKQTSFDPLPAVEEKSSDDERHSAHLFHNSFSSSQNNGNLLNDGLPLEGDRKEVKAGEDSSDNPSTSSLFDTSFADTLGSLFFTTGTSNEDATSTCDSGENGDELDHEEEEGRQHSFAILGTSAYDIAARPHVLSPPLMDSLRPHMPYAIQEDNFWLKYSLVRDGASMNIILKNMRSSVRTLMAIETTNGELFGCFTSSPWRSNGNNYYGSCEAFLWRVSQSRLTPCATASDQAKLESDVEIFKWSGKNRNVQLSNPRKLIVGGGEPEEKEDGTTSLDYGFGLALNADLSSGTSGLCVTFGSPALPKQATDVFEVSNLELWTMTPVDTVDKAEKLEFTRQFVFDHANVRQKA